MIPLRLALVCLLTLVGTSAGTSAQPDHPAQPFLKNYCVQCHGPEKQKGKLTLNDLGSDFSNPDTADRWIEVLDQLTSEDMPPEEEDKQPDESERTQIITWINQQLKNADQGEAYRRKLLAPEYGNWVDHEKLFSGEIDTLPYSPTRLWRYSPEIFNRKGFGNARSPFTYVTSEKSIRDYSAMSTVDQSTVQMILINADQFFEERLRKGEFKIFAEGKPRPGDDILAKTIEEEFRRIVGRSPIEEDRDKYLTLFKKSIEIGGNLDGLRTLIKALFLKPEAIYRMEFGLGKIDEHGRRHLSSNEIVQAIAYALTDEAPQKNKILWSAYQGGQLNTTEDISRVVRQMLDAGPGQWDKPTLPRIMRFFEQFFGFDRAVDVFKDNQRVRLEGHRTWRPEQFVRDARILIEYVLKNDRDVIAELLTTDKWFVSHPGDNRYARRFYEEKIARVTHPDYLNNEIAKVEEQIARQQKKADPSIDLKVLEKRWENQRRRVREGAEFDVKYYTKALEKGMVRHPEFPFSDQSTRLGGLIAITPYNLEPNDPGGEQHWAWPLEQPFKLPGQRRAGLLTHPAWLAAWSLNEGNDPIHRGIWVREKLLAGKLQDVPPDVDAKITNDPHKTLRERMEPLREERCWNCHHKINPLGETFEMFDDWGRYRTELYFDRKDRLVTRRDREFETMLKTGQLTSRPVDASGAITGSGDPTVDGTVNDAVEMILRIGRSGRARQSVIRHLFRYFLGRNEMLSDSKTLIAAEQAYLKNDGSFNELIISLLSSDSFLYRR